jgi:hypothetical protein
MSDKTLALLVDRGQAAQRQPKQRASFRVPPSVLEALEALATSERRTLSQTGALVLEIALSGKALS